MMIPKHLQKSYFLLRIRVVTVDAPAVGDSEFVKNYLFYCLCIFKITISMIGTIDGMETSTWFETRWSRFYPNCGTHCYPFLLQNSDRDCHTVDLIVNLFAYEF